jgi:putative DNA primase/helicase
VRQRAVTTEKTAVGSIPNRPAGKAGFYADPDQRPGVLSPDLDAVPAALRDEPRWVLWRLVWKSNRKGEGKWDKPPFQPSARPAKSNDPATWTTFDAAAAAYRHGRFDGVGFVLGDGFAGVDLDDVRDPDAGALTPEAAALVARFATYADVSPSGTGVKLVGRGDWRAGWHKRPFPGGGEVEAYSAGRYFTVTGRPVGPLPVAGYPVAEIQAALDEMTARFAGPRTGGNRSNTLPPAGGNDDEVIRRAAAAASGDKFRRLWAGDTTDHGGDQSRADLALCGMLAYWAGPDADRIDRLFRRSGLMRPKWDERRGASTYAQRTVAKALEGKTEFFDWGSTARATFTGAGSPASTRAGSGTSDTGPVGGPPNDGPDNPHRLAAGFLAAVSPGGPPYRLRYWRGEFHRYAGGAYRPVPDDDLRAELTEWVRAEFVRLNTAERAAAVALDTVNRPPRVRPVTVQLIGNVLQALRGRCLLPAAVEAPAWIDGATGPDPARLLPVRNGLLDLDALAAGRSPCLLPPSASFFTPTALPFDFDPHAPAPREWLRFLSSVWPDDPESVACLQTWFGYLLTPDTRQQKILFLLGPRRGGKGTIARVLRELVGPLNMAGPTLGSLATNFGLAPLLGKSVAVVSDARLSGRSDATVITERLLSISGEDAMTVDRKHRDPITVKLPTRFVILSNELPRLGDASRALAGRLVLLRLTRSWFGKEDHGLFDRLQPELPGALLWAVEGWRRLRDRGRFVQPESGAELVRDMEDLSSPVGAFVRDRCRVGPGAQVEVGELYREWRAWCEDHGRKEPGTEETFGRDLRAAVPEVEKTRPRVEGGRQSVYTGIRLRTDTDPDDGDEDAADGRSGHRGHRDPPMHAWGDRNGDGEHAGNGLSGTEGTMPGHGDHGDHPDRLGPDRLFGKDDFRRWLPPD